MRNFLVAALSAAVLAAFPARAQIVDHGSYLTDTASGLDWLDVTASVNMSFNQVSAQFGVGGQFAGWRYAIDTEFNTLVSNYTGVPIAAGNFGQVNQEPDRIDGLVSLLGSTLDSYYQNYNGITYDQALGVAEGAGVDYSYGLIGSLFGGNPRLALVYDNELFGGSDFTQAHYTTELPNAQQYFSGSFLVRSTVPPIPEPETYAMLLAGLGLLGWHGVRRKRGKAVTA